MARPRPITIMPSVMMKGGSRPSVMPAPLTAPSATPMASPASMTSGIGMPASSSIAETTAATATIEPTERSMPAVRMTKVMPTETMPNSATWRSTLIRLNGIEEGVRDQRRGHAHARPAPRPGRRP